MRALSPERQSMFLMPIAAAPITSDCRPVRVRSRAAICMTGSAPFSMAILLQAMLDIRGVAEGQSVKFTAAVWFLTMLMCLVSRRVAVLAGGATSVVTTNSPAFRRRSNSEIGSS